MIQTNELRVGNLFWDEDQEPCYYAGFWNRDDGGIHRDSGNNTYKNLQMYPIPLTPEILKKCLFIDYAVVGFYYLEIGNDTVLMSGGDSVWIEKIVDGMEGHSVGLGGATSVHQLQNLYYALTGTELEIKL